MPADKKIKKKNFRCGRTKKKKKKKNSSIKCTGSFSRVKIEECKPILSNVTYIYSQYILSSDASVCPLEI
jgi:hypothetical protein